MDYKDTRYLEELHESKKKAKQEYDINKGVYDQLHAKKIEQLKSIFDELDITVLNELNISKPPDNLTEVLPWAIEAHNKIYKYVEDEL